MFSKKSSPMAQISGWDVLASLGDSLAVQDTSYRLIWSREPLLARYRPEVVPVLGRCCFDVFADRDRPCEHDCPVRQVLDSGRPFCVERRTVLPDGGQVWREARAYPVTDGNGRVVLVARISFDITRRKQNQQRRENHQAALENCLADLNRLQVQDLPFARGPAQSLTAREIEVLRLVAQGLSKPRIAGVLGLSPHTVKRHVDHIFDKLGVGSQAQAAVWAARQGLV